MGMHKLPIIKGDMNPGVEYSKLGELEKEEQAALYIRICHGQGDEYSTKRITIAEKVR